MMLDVAGRGAVRLPDTSQGGTADSSAPPRIVNNPRSVPRISGRPSERPSQRRLTHWFTEIPETTGMPGARLDRATWNS